MDREDLFRLIDSFHICEADWNLYQELFMNGPARADTLNSLSGPFLMAIHRCLIEITFVRIAKLTDKRQTGNFQNLTLDTLREANKHSFGMKEKYEATVESAAVKTIRDYRRKIHAHTDLDISRLPDPSTELGLVIHNHVTMALEHIRAFLYEYCNEIGLPTPRPRPVPNIGEFLAKFNCGDFPDDAARY